MEQIRPFALRTERVVGRSREIEAIRAALADPTRRTHILYFIGPGGIGKTRLLEEVESLAADWEPELFLYTGIIDLYHSEFHSIGGIRAAIADGLDLENRHFQAYRERYQRFEAQRAAGVTPEVLERGRRELTRFFLADYNRIARERRILLRFDTMELVQYESDLVQWDVAAGSPIRLALAVEVAQRGLGFDKFRKKISEAPAEEAREEIDRLLIEQVMNGDPNDSVRKVLCYLAVARRGLDARLLHHLAGEWDGNTCQANLEAGTERSFVKQHPEEESLFLHDEMYRLCDNYLLSPEEVQCLSQSIVEWYEEQINAFGDKRSGNLAFDLGTEGGSKSAPREVLAETGEHCLPAAACFEEYSERAVGLRAAFRQMYGRFKHSILDELAYLQKEALPQITDKYGIDMSRLGSFFEDTLGLAIEL